MTTIRGIAKDTTGIYISIIITAILSCTIKGFIVSNIGILIGYISVVSFIYLVIILGKDEICGIYYHLDIILNRLSKVDIVIGLLIPIVYFMNLANIYID